MVAAEVTHSAKPRHCLPMAPPDLITYCIRLGLGFQQQFSVTSIYIECLYISMYIYVGNPHRVKLITCKLCLHICCIRIM